MESHNKRQRKPSGFHHLLMGLLICCALAIPQSSIAKAKLGYRLQLLLHELHESNKGGDWRPSSQLVERHRLYQDGAGWQLPLWVGIKGNSRADALLSVSGLKIRSQFGNILTVDVPLHNLDRLANHPEVSELEAVRKLTPTMELERRETRADVIHNGTYTGTAYDGTGVIISTIDIGFDYVHPNFYDSTGTRSRIFKVWDQTRRAGSPPAGYSYGSEWRTPQDWEQAQSDTFMAFTHGGHTAGISGGSGHGTNGFFRGMAPAADLIFIPSTFFDDHIADAVRYSHEQANAVGKRVVINMSFGGWGGPMDGSELFDRTMDQLATQLTPNPILVAAMGNEGGFEHYVEFTPTSVTDTLRTVLGVNRFSSFFYGEPQPQFWAPADKPFQVRVSVLDTMGNVVHRYQWFSNARQQAPTLLPKWYGGTDSVFIGIYMDSAYGPNNLKHTLVHSKPYATNHYVMLEVTGTPGSRIAGIFFAQRFWDKPGPRAVRMPGFTAGSRRNNYRSPGGTCQYVVGVGAYVSRTQFTNENGVIQKAPVPDTTVGALADFSSRGPGLGQYAFGVRPTVTAPGRIVLSSLSSFTQDDPNIIVSRQTFQGFQYPYGGLSGTSMATPMVTGAVALLLQAFPTLNSEQVQRILAVSARKDAFTGPLTSPAFDWGSGKLNIAEAIEQASMLVGTAPAKPRINVALYPNPTRGQVNIRLPEEFGEAAQVIIRSSSGQILGKYSLAAGTHRIDISVYPAGIYHLQVLTSSAQSPALAQSVKFVVQ